jgi:penicillin-binding protein 1C
VVALDPDISPARQRIRFAAQGAAQPRWRLDGKLLPASPGRHDWAPWPGRHRLELLDAGNRVLDQVEFDVRGALAKISYKK